MGFIDIKLMHGDALHVLSEFTNKIVKKMDAPFELDSIVRVIEIERPGLEITVYYITAHTKSSSNGIRQHRIKVVPRRSHNDKPSIWVAETALVKGES